MRRGKAEEEIFHALVQTSMAFMALIGLGQSREPRASGIWARTQVLESSSAIIAGTFTRQLDYSVEQLTDPALPNGMPVSQAAP